MVIAISKRTKRRRSFYDHQNDRYSCTDVVQIGGSILSPTAHTAARVPARISEQQCCNKINRGTFELGVASTRFRATVLHGESTNVPVWNWKLLGSRETCEDFPPRIEAVGLRGSSQSPRGGPRPVVRGSSASRQTSQNVYRKRVWGSSVLASVGSGDLWVCGPGWFSRGFPVCGLPFLCPLVFLDVHSRSVDLAVTELRRAPTQEPAPYRYPLQV